MPNTPAVSQPSLVEVQEQFAAWRKIRKHRERIPKALWSAAVKLCEIHSIHKISRALRLNHSALRDRVADRQATQLPVATTSPKFFAIDMGQPPCTECIIEMEHRNGNRMSMHLKGQVNFDLQSFAESFWN